jgi:urease accessory protein
MSSSVPEVGRTLPAYIRAAGAVRLGFAAAGGRTRLIVRDEGGGYLVRTPRHDGPGSTAVLLNTGGGMAGGDRLSFAAEIETGAIALIAMQAAEKIYRSQGPATRIDVSLRLAPESRLDWLPQETILFSGSVLQRSLNADVAADAVLTIGESLVFGRSAMNEAFEAGAYRDRWRIHRAGKLLFAEDVRLDGAPALLLARPASGRGARAVATILHVAPDAEAKLDAARAALGGGPVECGASAWQGLLLMRFLAQDAQALRLRYRAALAWLCGDYLPRWW